MVVGDGSRQPQRRKAAGSENAFGPEAEAPGPMEPDCRTAGRYVANTYLPFSTSINVLPIRAGDGDTLMPAASMAADFDFASPLPPEMIAPA